MHNEDGMGLWARTMQPRSALVLIFLLTGLLTGDLWAQAGQAELTGEVRDASGGLVPQARVVLTGIETNQSRTTNTNAAGVYTFTSVKPGLYQLACEAQGFKRFVREQLQMLTGERVRLDIDLLVGALEESVTVQSGTPILATESGDLGQVVSNQIILMLPLNGRSFVSLVGLAAGVALPPGSSFPRINGGRPRTNEYLFDGICVLQPEPGTIAFSPVIDAIQEFKVETNSPPAEFGRFNGGVVNLTTKAGTNELHGSIFEFLRNEALNARNLFAPATPANPNKPLFRRNQFGFVLGGPLQRNKTFFFVDYQGSRQQIGRVRISTVPTLLQRQGIFTEVVGGKTPQIFDPLTTRPKPGGGSTRDPFVGGVIPPARIDAVAKLLLQRFPLPTTAGTANNYTRIGTESDDQNQFDVRLDHKISERDRIFGRFSYTRDSAVPVTPFPDGSGNITSGTVAPGRTTGHSVVVDYTHAFSSRWLNELRFGYTRRAIDQSALLNAPPSQALQLPGIPSSGAFHNELPTFAISGFQQIGPPSNTDALFRTDVTEVVDAISSQRGKHFIKMGLDFRWERLDITQPPFPTGLFQFNNLFTDLPGSTGTGNPFASFLLGQVQNFSIDLQGKPIRPRAHIQEYYIQDNWKVTPRLTLDVGVRYTLNFPSTEVDNQGAVFNLQTQQLDYLGQSGNSRSARELHKHDFGPRIGVALRLTDKTVVRSGYGLIWIEQAGITTPFTTPQFPFIQTVTQRTLNNINPAFTLAGGPSVAPPSLTPDAGLGQGVFGVDQTLGSGYAQQWNLSVQRQITANMSIEVAYTGSKITHVGIPDTNINQLTADQLALGSTLLKPVPNPFFGQIPRSSSLGDPTIPFGQLLKPFPRFTTVSLFRNNVGNTNYNAVQVKVEKRWSNGFSALASYTRSKLLDDASSVFSASIFTGPIANFPVADSFNRHVERDVSSGDTPNNFVASFTYQLPFGRHLAHGLQGMTGKILGGWEITGIVSLQSGLPLAVTQATNFNAFAGFGTQRPNESGNPKLSSGHRSTAQWFNTAAFAIAPQFTLGTSSRNPVRGPGYQDVDLAIIKRTNFNERMNLEFRTEIFNLTNTPPLGTPNTVLGTPGFGSITSAGDPRVIQFGLKFGF
ncbi:MAG: carboxypeptidase regulatory-like domain-containing protein [Terriglobia bacterium]